MEDERDIKAHFVNGVDVIGVPTVTVSRAWSLESGESDTGETDDGLGTTTTTMNDGSGVPPQGDGAGRTTPMGVRSRRSFDNQ